MKKYVIGLLLSGIVPLAHAFPMNDGSAGSQLTAVLDLSASALEGDSRSDCMLRLSESMFEINRSAGSSCGGMPWVYEIDEDARLSVSKGAGGGAGAGDAGVQDFDSSLFGSVGSGSYLEAGSESLQQRSIADNVSADEQAVGGSSLAVGGTSRGIVNSVGEGGGVASRGAWSLGSQGSNNVSQGSNVVRQSADQEPLHRLKLARASTGTLVTSQASNFSIVPGSSSTMSTQAPATSGSDVTLPGRPAFPAMPARPGLPAPSAASTPGASVIGTERLAGLAAADPLSVIDPLTTKAEAMTQSPLVPSAVTEPCSLLLLFAGLGLLFLQRKSKPLLVLVQA